MTTALRVTADILLPDGEPASAGEVVRVSDADAEKLLAAGVAEDVSDVAAVRISGMVVGFEPGQVVPVVAHVRPDFESPRGFFLADVARRIRQRPDQEENIRAALRASSFPMIRLAADLPVELLEQPPRDAVQVSEALALVDEGLAEIVTAAQLVPKLPPAGA